MSDKQLGFSGFIKLMIEALEAAKVDYLIGGAIAAWAWGEPRATQDVDLVVDIPEDAIQRLSEELEKRDMLVPPEIILEHIYEDRANLAINAIHSYTGYKAELFPLRKKDVLRQSAFARRIKVDFGPELGEVYIHSPEDLILYKLIYFGISRQTKHTRDIGAILISLGDKLDYKYIEKWAAEKGVSRIWEEILGEL